MAGLTLAQWQADVDEERALRAFGQAKAGRAVRAGNTAASSSPATPSVQRARRRTSLVDLAWSAVFLAVAVITGWICSRLIAPAGGF